MTVVPRAGKPPRLPRHIRRVAALLLLAVTSVGAAPPPAAPVRSIDIYVQPYYEAARQPGTAPRVSVAKAWDAQLASLRQEDIARVRDAIQADNALITPMTLMVLAIRLYDTGQRDDAVFWFYAAKYRYATLAEVADVRSPALAQVEDAVRSFALLAGPVINGYAFCDVQRQMQQNRAAAQWVAANPYRALMLPQIPARPGDRAENLARAVARIDEAVRTEQEKLARPAELAALATARRDNGAEAKYCWR